MRVVVQKDLADFRKFRNIPPRLEKRFREEAYRGLRDAGRKMLTMVRKTARTQMNLRPGYYGSYIVAQTMGRPIKGNPMRYDIEGGTKGGYIPMYGGLKGGRKLRRKDGYNIQDLEKGRVYSEVWNVGRIFKRSFATPGGWYALRPGNSLRAPRLLWTYGRKPNQGRDSFGRFMPTGKRYGKVRKLFGPSLYKELRDANRVKRGPNWIHIRFMREAPVELELQVMKRVTKLMTF